MKITSHLIVAVFLFVLIAACKQKLTLTHKDIPSIASFDEPLYLDSIFIEKFLSENLVPANQRSILFDFYKRRNFAYAWIRTSGVNEQAGGFINLLANERKMPLNDSNKIILRLGEIFNEVSGLTGKVDSSNSLVPELELRLSAAFIDYAKRNWGGIGEAYSYKAGWFIDRKKLNYSSLLDSMLAGNMKEEPVYRQYTLLKDYLFRYYGIEESGKWDSLTTDVKRLRWSDTSEAISEIRNELYLLGDMKKNDSSTIFDSTLVVAVQQFQKRHGLVGDGIIAMSTIKAMRYSIHSRIEQIMVNMERCRWVPLDVKGDFIAINIPAFKLYAHRNSRPEFSCNIVVGKEKTKTAIFNGTFQYIVFNPYWNIPRSIIVKEILPAVKANKNYLVNHNMEVTDNGGKVIPSASVNWNKYTGNNFPYSIRQQPGDDNALGRIKFLFPNSFDIYLHDTPAKSLFGESKRAFSHGCIRVEDARGLAEFLLDNENDWTGEEIEKMMAGNKEQYVKLKNNIPVFIAYFTAWVDREGQINFRDDVYGYDEKLKELLLQ